MTVPRDVPAPTCDHTRTYVNADDAEIPGFSVFTRHDAGISHFYVAN